MKECYMCGITEDKALLYEGVHKTKGIVSVCRKCYFKNKMPLVDKKEVPAEVEEKRETVRERLEKISHLKPMAGPPMKKFHESYENVQLRDIVEKNFKKEALPKTKPPEDLVDNFHWVIMRKRRSVKISKEQLSEAIHEPLIAIESLEKGVVPRDYRQLVKKVENKLGVNLFKNKNIDHNDIINESRVPSGILIEDLKKAREKEKEKYIDASSLSLDRVNEIYGIPVEGQKTKEESKEDSGEYFTFKNPFKRKKYTYEDSPKEKPEKDKKNKVDKDDLSDDDISKLVWGK